MYFHVLGQSQIRLQYNGATMPTSASITMDNGDGSVPASQNFGINSQGGTQMLAHTYTQDGLFDAVITVYNDATSVSRTVQVTISVKNSFS